MQALMIGAEMMNMEDLTHQNLHYITLIISPFKDTFHNVYSVIIIHKKQFSK